ncbi:hypothetical protein IPdc08_01145 [archaeon]|nr:hypothetical protein IPdc08_01145 [archaeon]
MPSISHGRISLSAESDKKAQITIEVIVVIGIFLIVFSSLINLSFERFHLAQEVGSAGEAKMTGQFIASAINNVYSNGGGFSIHLNENKINFSELSSSEIRGSGIILPIIVNNSERRVVINKNFSSMGGTSLYASIPIIPDNITRENSTLAYPQLTIRNNGTDVIIYASIKNIRVVS